MSEFLSVLFTFLDWDVHIFFASSAWREHTAHCCAERKPELYACSILTGGVRYCTSFRILAPLAEARGGLCEERLDSCVRAASGTFAGFVFPLCYKIQRTKWTLTAAVGTTTTYVWMFYIPRIILLP